MDGVTLQSHFSLWASVSLVNDGAWTRKYLWPLLILKVCVVSMEGLKLGTLQNWWVWILVCRRESTWVTQQLSDLAMRPHKVQEQWQMGECMSLGGRGEEEEGVVSLIWLTADLWECWFSGQIWFPKKCQTSTFYKSGIFQFLSVAINSKCEKCIVRANPNILRPELAQRSLIAPPDLKQWTANAALGTQGNQFLWTLTLFSDKSVIPTRAPSYAAHKVSGLQGRIP